MKKILLGLFVLSSGIMAAENNLYLKTGLDSFGEFKEVKVEGVTLNKKAPKKIGYEFALESTRNITPELETGFGVAYQVHGKLKAPNNEILTNKTLPEFKSIPVYAIAKYNFSTESNFRPYLKADLGYSFNKKNSKTYSSNGAELNYSYKNGVYFGVGGGVEYNNIVLDLMYKMNYGKVKVGLKDGANVRQQNAKIDYGRITLSLGYKFNF